MAPPPLAELTARAQTLTSAGDLVGARRVLANVLDPADADPSHADPDLALAAALHARILIALGDPHGARLWAGFAHAAEDRLHGSRHERTMAAAATHAAVLQRVGHHGKAAQVYQTLVRNLTDCDGGRSPRVLAAEADLATAEHAAGHCTSARHRLTDAWVQHRHQFGDANPAGIKMLARLGAMERECARDAESHEHLALAQELCARYLPADHPLVRQVAQLATATATGRHTCGRVAQSAGPAVSDPAGPATANGSGPPPAEGQPTGRGMWAAGPATANSSGPPSAEGHPTGGGMWAAGPATANSSEPPPAEGHPTGGGMWAAGPATGGRSPAPPPIPFPRRPTVPDPADGGFPPDVMPILPPPDNRPTDPNGTVYQQPLYLADMHQAPGDPTGRHARADTPPPLPGHRAPDYGPDGHRQLVGSAPASTLETPPNSERLLPVRVPREPRRQQPFLLMAVLIAGIAVAAVVVALTLPDANSAVGPSGTGAPAAPTATVVPSTPAGSVAASGTPEPGAPTSVQLRDNRDSVALSWKYPPGAEGPVLISGGRQGQEVRVFQQLAAGSADYVVYGLNESQNYCFTVAVAYSADRIAASAPICTRR